MTDDLWVGPGITAVAGSDVTDSRDASAYLVEDSGELALIDSGAGPSYPRILERIRAAGYDPGRLRYVIATHAHVDHIGALASFVRDFSPAIVAHELDAWAIESPDPDYTASSWYNLELPPVKVDLRLTGRLDRLPLGETELICLHAPGHTPGSMVVYLDREGLRYLFGQDIHGPFHPGFRSNVQQWAESMDALIELKADVLAEGHFGVIRGADQVAEFIQGYKSRHGFGPGPFNRKPKPVNYYS